MLIVDLRKRTGYDDHIQEKLIVPPSTMIWFNYNMGIHEFW